MLHRSIVGRCVRRGTASGAGGAAPANVTITVKNVIATDMAITVSWPPQDAEKDAAAAPAATVSSISSKSATSMHKGSSGYVRRRSPFSMLHSRHTPVGFCSSAVLPRDSSSGSVVAHLQCRALCGNQGCSGGEQAKYGVGSGYGLAMCCCSALCYPATATNKNKANNAEAQKQQACDSLVLALKLSDTEGILREVIGNDLYVQLVGPELANSGLAVGLCSDPSTWRGADTTSDWVATALLSADEDNRVRWLKEEMIEARSLYGRAPSLRALYVFWSTAHSDSSISSSNSSPDTVVFPPPPTLADIQLVMQRMRLSHLKLSPCDLAAFAVFALQDAQVHTVFLMQLAVLSGTELAAATAKASGGYDYLYLPREVTALDHVLIVTLLCKCAHATVPPQVHESSTRSAAAGISSADGRDPEEALTAQMRAVADRIKARNGDVESASMLLGGSTSGCPSRQVMELLHASSFVAVMQARAQSVGSSSSFRSASCPSRMTEQEWTAISTLADAFLRDIRALIERCDVPTSSPSLNEITVWLLREVPGSPACRRHLKRVVEHHSGDAMNVLETAGLLGKTSAVNLPAVVHDLVPLLEYCGNEDFYTLAMREVISGLEDRLRRDPSSFTEEDMQLLAELGTQLFAYGPYETARSSRFDITARGQLEELRVMDGGPLTLVVSTYRSLKEMLQNLMTENRRLKEQVQEQVRNIAMSASAASAVEAAAVSGAPHDSNEVIYQPSYASDVDACGSSRSAAFTSSTSSACQQQHQRKGKVASSMGASVQPRYGAEAPIMISVSVRQRFLVLVEDLVKALVDEKRADAKRPIVISTELFNFVNRHVPVPNIQDEYRRKIFLLVNVAEDAETVEKRAEARKVAELVRSHAKEAEARHIPGGEGSASHKEKGTYESVIDDNLHGGAEDIPAELRFLVSSLPLTLSPWASVMILREVLAESAGNNPRYSYVLNAAINLQLPISTTRSRIATTLNMWRFLNTQSHKLSLKESVMVKQRCFWNLPFSYVLSSYWSLLTSFLVASIIMLNIVGLDFESQLVANSLFQKLAPWEEIDVERDEWNREAAPQLAAEYLGQDEIAARHKRDRSSTNLILSSASYLFLGYDEQRRPMTVVTIKSDPSLSPGKRQEYEYRAAFAVLRELSLHVPFPFYIDLERPMPVEYVEARVAERIRRVSYNNTWSLPRMIIRMFPLGWRYTERSLISHTCAQANLTRRRVTFLVYVHSGVPITPKFLEGLANCQLSRSANLVLVVHESSARMGGVTPMCFKRINTQKPRESQFMLIPSAPEGMEETTAAVAAAMVSGVAGPMPVSVLPTRSKIDDSGGAASASSMQTERIRVLSYGREKPLGVVRVDATNLFAPLSRAWHFLQPAGTKSDANDEADNITSTSSLLSNIASTAKTVITIPVTALRPVSDLPSPAPMVSKEPVKKPEMGEKPASTTPHSRFHTPSFLKDVRMLMAAYASLPLRERVS